MDRSFSAARSGVVSRRDADVCGAVVAVTGDWIGAGMGATGVIACADDSTSGVFERRGEADALALGAELEEVFAAGVAGLCGTCGASAGAVSLDATGLGMVAVTGVAGTGADSLGEMPAPSRAGSTRNGGSDSAAVLPQARARPASSKREPRFPCLRSRKESGMRLEHR